MHEAEAMFITGRTIPRSLEELADINLEWENTIFTDYGLIRHHVDYLKLPADVRAMLERARDNDEEEKIEMEGKAAE